MPFPCTLSAGALFRSSLDKIISPYWFSYCFCAHDTQLILPCPPLDTHDSPQILLSMSARQHGWHLITEMHCQQICSSDAIHPNIQI